MLKQATANIGNIQLTLDLLSKIFLMNFQTEKFEDSCCPRAEIAEYIDGELPSQEELALELHFANCKICVEELNAQKKVSSTLEILLQEDKDSIELPANFTKVVTANAESNLDGLRSPKERSRALIICVILFLLMVFGFGTESQTVFFAVEKFSEQFLAVSGFVFHLFYALAVGISAIFGSVCHKLIFKSGLMLLLIVGLFVFAFLILSRMVFRFNRT